MASGVYIAIRWAVNAMRKKLVTYVDAELVAALSAIATRDDRRIPAVEEDAVKGFLAAKQVRTASKRRAYLRGAQGYPSLYKALGRAVH